jgi:hypothetical protein
MEDGNTDGCLVFFLLVIVIVVLIAGGAILYDRFDGDDPSQPGAGQTAHQRKWAKTLDTSQQSVV